MSHHHHDHCCHEHSDCCHEEHHHHHHEHEHQGDFAHQLLEMADEAWMEVLKEKIKDHIRKTNGDKMDQLAKVISEGNHNRWKNKLALQNSVHTYQEQINDFFQNK